MSVKIHRGEYWFRPMRIELQVVFKNYEQMKMFIKMLDTLGFEQEANDLQLVLEREEHEAGHDDDFGYYFNLEKARKNEEEEKQDGCKDR